MATGKKTTAISVLALATLVLAPLAHAQQIGTVLMTRARVEARDTAGNSRALQRRAPLMAGDTVVTGVDGFAQLRMVDDAQLALGAGTEFQFTTYVYDGDPATPDSAVMNLVRGCFLTMSGTIGDGPGDQYRIDAPVASISIRGTVHTATYVDDVLYTATYEGGTTVHNGAGALDLGFGGAYDFSRTTAGSTPEGLIDAPSQLAGCAVNGARQVSVPATPATPVTQARSPLAPQTDYEVIRSSSAP